MGIKFTNRVAFIICVIVLAGSAISKHALINALQIVLTKEAIELKTSFDNLSDDKLGVYSVAKKSIIENKDVLNELGTNDYLIWELEDTSVPDSSNTKYCSLFITYYTGINDRIPHVPEECYFGAGNRVKGTLDESFILDRKLGVGEDITYRRLVFTSQSQDIWGSGSEFSVCYVLRVNGKYAGNRIAARNLIARNLFGKYSYFSKVEWRFNGKFGQPTDAEVTEATAKMLGIVLPILEEEHWPDLTE